MKKSKFWALIACGVAILAGVIWTGIGKLQCRRRGEVLERQLKTVERDAKDQLKIGTRREDVAKFFDEHALPFTVAESTAYGTLYTIGCAPFGCGTDRGMIGVRVKLDAAGAVAEEPRVVGMYVDCL
jgi:hypothetical protein